MKEERLNKMIRDFREKATLCWNKNGSQNIPASAAFPRAAGRSWEAWRGTVSGIKGRAGLVGTAGRTLAAGL